MKKIIAAAAVLAAFAAPALAADKCNVPQAEWQPKEALIKKLEGEGWKIKTVKTEDGCYEVYGTDGKGTRHETFFDPKTFEAVGED